MNTTHVLKTRSTYLDKVRRGDKTFEVRINDRGFQRGDTLVLIQYDEYGDCTSLSCKEHRATDVIRVVTFVYSGDPTLRDNGGIQPGHVVLGLADPLGEPER